MTIPKIVQVAGSRHSEYVILTCTGCNEYYSYSVRQYKGDFGCNISEFEQFLQWATWEAAKHECFLAGSRTGYLVEPEVDAAIAEVLTHTDADDDLDAWLDSAYPEVGPERHEDPKVEQVMREAMNPLLQGSAPDGIPYDDLDDEGDLDDWLDEEQGLRESDNYDWEENRFDFLYDQHWPYVTVTGRISVRHPTTIREIDRVHSFDIETDYARMIDQMLLDAGVYRLDVHGCLRDEKGRCLACLRPGPHLPFYYKKPTKERD